MNDRRLESSVIGFTLLKVFCVTETPEWWITEPPKAQEGAWNAPTREIHYLPAKADDDVIKIFQRDLRAPHCLCCRSVDSCRGYV